MSLNLPFKNINEFFLQEIIQDGPHTVIFRGYQKNLKRNVLIKLLKPHSSKELKERFNREARVYAKLNHPHIVSVFALGEIQNYMYIILEFVHGCSLKTLLEKGTLPHSILWDIGYHILDALKHSSGKKVVHRDIKPANIMIDIEGKIKVTDFGLALISDEPNITKQQALIGTPAYMSPEQISGAKIDISSDIFSFGSMLYEMIYQEQAFGKDSFSASINSILNDIPARLDEQNGLPAGLKAFLAKCLQKDKNERWASIDEALNAWQKLKNDLKSAEKKEDLKSLVEECSSKTFPDLADSKIFQSKNPVKIWTVSATIFFLFLFVIVFFPQEEKLPEQVPQGKNVLQQADDYDELKADSVANSVKKSEIKKPARLQKETTIINTPVVEENTDTLKMISTEPAVLEFDIIPWAMVYINDSLIDSHLVKQSINISAAQYTLLMKHPKFPAEKKTINLNPGEKKVIHWSFWEKTGFLDLQVRPWAEVYINNEYFDTTPFKKPLQLPVGTQVLELRHPALQDYKELITIIQSDTLVIKKNLTTQGGIIFE